ncbi:hypothetical protein [Halobacillus sp. H74]|uniref:hypothetical protein n=1 Tax=Halobacillus sp. H74 TaxID=3457436 RepID=UPI003FCC46AD
MFNRNRLLILTGSLAIFFSSGALLTKHEEVLLEPIVQGNFGFVTVFMASAGVTAYRKKRKGRGSFFTFVTLFLTMVAERFNKDDWYKKIE